MKKILLLLVSIISIVTYSQDLEYDSWVTDYADVLSSSEEQILNSVIADYEKTTSVEFSIVTVTSLNGQPIEGFTSDLFNKWGIGKKDYDNGLMILISPNDRLWRVEVGNALEEYLTDSYTYNVANDNFPNNFRNDDYYGGIYPTVITFQEKLGNLSWIDREKEFAQAKADRRQAGFNVLKVLGLLLTIIFLIYLIFSRIRNKKELIENVSKLKNKMDKSIDKFKSNYSKASKYGVDINYNKLLSDMVQAREFATMMPFDKDIIVNEHKKALTTIQGLMKSPNDKMITIIEDNELLKSITRFINLDKIGDRVSNIKSKIELFNDKNVGKYKVDFNSHGIDANIDSAYKKYELMKEFLSIEKIKELGNTKNLVDDFLYKADSIVTRAHTEINMFYDSMKGIEDKLDSISSVIDKMESECRKSHVSSATKSLCRKSLESFKSYIPNYNQDSVLLSHRELQSIISSMEEATRRAKRDHDTEVANIARKKRAKERARRSASSGYGYGSSSGSSFGSSSFGSSGSSFGGFGGGSSSGGGSTGGW
jgi:uncharacterized protein